MCAESTCEVKFSVFHRRHHCRRCGEIFCSSHASKMAHLSVADRRFRSDGIEAKVCDLCFEATEGIHIARDLGLTM
ncbi:hypothetical protein BC829DRAFT_379398 [Chytridium lagenaria]|nr:hypothetical protein BC829DRAFT_379398 [Chytridium lagenaria]